MIGSINSNAHLLCVEFKIIVPMCQVQNCGGHVLSKIVFVMCYVGDALLWA